jgi:hypothetical protein
MTFKLEHHNKILTILESLNSNIFEENSAYFGGGTILALDFGEYRWSKDIDFICSISSSGYRNLRTILFDGGYEALFRDLKQIQIGRGTTDQYAIRMLIKVDNTPIKTEIIAESRFELESPRYPNWSPVPCLSLNDCFTSKLLANADRFMDDSVEARDLIDLAVLRLQSSIPQEAIDKAEKAYEVIRPLTKAIQYFQYRTDYRERFFDGLEIDRDWIPKIIDGIDLLAEDFDMTITERSFKEKHDLF